MYEIVMVLVLPISIGLAMCYFSRPTSPVFWVGAFILATIAATALDANFGRNMLAPIMSPIVWILRSEAFFTTLVILLWLAPVVIAMYLLAGRFLPQLPAFNWPALRWPTFRNPFSEDISKIPLHVRKAEALKLMQQAKQYIDGYYQQKEDRDKLNYIRFAAERIERARKLDPEAILEVDDKAYDISLLSALALFVEGQYLMVNDKWADARKVYEKAIKFAPKEPQLYDCLAECHIQMTQRRKAFKVLEANPNPTQRTIELTDRLNGDFWLGRFFKPAGYLVILALVLFVAGFFTHSDLSFLAIIPFGIAWYIAEKNSGMKYTMLPGGQIKEEKLRKDKHEL